MAREARKSKNGNGGDAKGQLGFEADLFKAADKPCPDLHLIYAVAESLRSLSRHLNSFIAAAASGRADEAVTKLRDLIGPSADELLDEFIIAGVLDVGSSRTVPSGIAGRVR